MHKIDAPAFHPITLKRDPKALYFQGVKIVFDQPRGRAYRNGARITPSVKPAN